MCCTGVLKRPYEVTLDIQIQIRLLHLLQKINEGESLSEWNCFILMSFCVMTRRYSSVCDGTSQLTSPAPVCVSIFTCKMTLSAAESLERLNCLESALSLLEGVNQDFFIQLEDYNSLRMSLTELVSYTPSD